MCSTLAEGLGETFSPSSASALGGGLSAKCSAGPLKKAAAEKATRRRKPRSATALGERQAEGGGRAAGAEGERG